MTISRVGASQAIGNTITPPGSHQAGDLMLIFGHSSGTTAMVLPSGWFAALNLSITAARCLYFKWAESATESNVTITNAAYLHMWIGRGSSGLLMPGGTNQGVTGSTTTAAYPSTGFYLLGGPSWVVASGRTSAVDSTIDDAPSGLTNLNSQLDGSGESALHDSDGDRTGWGTINQSIGGTAGTVTRLICEVFESPLVLGGGGVAGFPLSRLVV